VRGQKRLETTVLIHCTCLHLHSVKTRVIKSKVTVPKSQAMEYAVTMLHETLTLALNRGKMSASCFGRFYPAEGIPGVQWTGGLQRQSGFCGGGGEVRKYMHFVTILARSLGLDIFQIKYCKNTAHSLVTTK
jgi:hypothetical protein